MWEVDLRMTADDEIVAFHDDALADGRAIADITYEEIKKATVHGDIPRFSDVIALAKELGAGIYADIKALEAAEPVCSALIKADLGCVILGAFDHSIVNKLGEIGAPFPRALLVPVGVDPFKVVGDAEIIHLCWERMDTPQDLLDEAFFTRCVAAGKQVVLWHEEDRQRMDVIRKLPVLGICSDQPELVNPFVAPSDWPVEIVCHRGANSIAPENSLKAARACFAAGFSHVELDVHVTRDRQLVVMHDDTLERTSNGTGLVTEHSLEELRALNVGGWFSDHYKDERIPTLSQILDLASDWGGKLYVELKSAPADLVWDCVCRYGMQDKCFFWSFNVQLLQDLRRISSDAKIMMRRQDFLSLEAVLANLAPSLVEYTCEDDLSELPELRKLGVRSMIAYNGEDEEVFRDIAAHRPDLVNLHRPFQFIRSVFKCGVGHE
jgi:glycerophosphoryl diester phosphodiesterase